MYYIVIWRSSNDDSIGYSFCKDLVVTHDKYSGMYSVGCYLNEHLIGISFIRKQFISYVIPMKVVCTI
jgi:hypothetical protein